MLQTERVLSVEQRRLQEQSATLTRPGTPHPLAHTALGVLTQSPLTQLGSLPSYSDELGCDSCSYQLSSLSNDASDPDSLHLDPTNMPGAGTSSRENSSSLSSSSDHVDYVALKDVLLALMAAQEINNASVSRADRLPGSVKRKNVLTQVLRVVPDHPGMSRSEFEAMAGFLIDTLCDIAKNPGMLKLLNRTKRSCLACFFPCKR